MTKPANDRFTLDDISGISIGGKQLQSTRKPEPPKPVEPPKRRPRKKK